MSHQRSENAQDGDFEFQSIGIATLFTIMFMNSFPFFRFHWSGIFHGMVHHNVQHGAKQVAVVVVFLRGNLFLAGGSHRVVRCGALHCVNCVCAICRDRPCCNAFGKGVVFFELLGSGCCCCRNFIPSVWVPDRWLGARSSHFSERMLDLSSSFRFDFFLL